jgi:hypothetical protein
MSVKKSFKMPSTTKSFAIFMTIMALSHCVLSHGNFYTPRATAASPVQKLTSRSLLDMLMGGSSLLGGSDDEKPATSASSSTTNKQSSSLVDLATNLIGKGEGNSGLYIKLFKLLLNLFMDVMMDRMGSERREDVGKINPLAPFFLRNRPLFVNLPSASPSLQALQSGNFKPYFVN